MARGTCSGLDVGMSFRRLKLHPRKNQPERGHVIGYRRNRGRYSSNGVGHLPTAVGMRPGATDSGSLPPHAFRKVLRRDLFNPSS
jgi:hypothetical protein